MGNTNIPQLSQDQWAQLGVEAFPGSWAGDPGKKPGGNFYALLKSMAANMIALNEQVRYAFLATRIDTAIDTALDNAARDFYGDDLPRLPGEEDSDYRIRIKAGFFIPYTTRQSFITALTRLLGETPRLIDPWNPSDTSAYDLSYYDVDLPEIGLPGLYGAPGKAMAYQVAIIATLPPTSLKTFGVLWGYDCGAAYDSYTAVYSPAKANQFFGPNLVDALIKRIKAAGITVWRKYLNQDLITYIIANTKQVAGDSFEFSSTILPVAGPYWVVVSGNWNSTYFVKQISSLSFLVGTGTPSPSGGGQLNTAVIPFTAHAGGIFSPVPGGYQSIVPRPANNHGARLAISPNWDTTLWISKEVGNNLIISSQNPTPPGGHVQYAFLPDNTSWYVTVEAGSPGCTINTPDLSGVPFCLPSWNTQVAVEMRNGIISATFNVDAPANAYVHIGYFKIGSNIYDVDAPPPPQPGPTPSDITGSGSFTLPSLQLSGNGVEGVFGTGSFTLPALQMSGAGGGSVYPAYVGSNENQRPTRIALSADGNVIYVNTYMANFIDTVVVAINRASGAVIAESPHYGDGVTTDYHPMSLNVSADGTKIFATFWRSGGVNGVLKVLNATTLAELNSIDLGEDIFDVDVSKNGTKMAVMGAVHVILVDLATFAVTTPWASSDWGLAWPQADSNHLYTWNGDTKQIYYYNLSGALLATLDPNLTGGIIECVRVHPTANLIFSEHRIFGNNNLFCYDPVLDQLLDYNLASGVPFVWAFDPANTSSGFIQGQGTLNEIDDAQNLSSLAFSPLYSGYDSLAIDSARAIAYTTAQTSKGGNPYALVLQSSPLPPPPTVPGPDAYIPDADWFFNDYVCSNDGDPPSRMVLSPDRNTIFVSTYLTDFTTCVVLAFQRTAPTVYQGVGDASLNPFGLFVDPDGSTLYGVFYDAAVHAVIQRISTNDLSVLGSVNLGVQIRDAAMSDDGTKMALVRSGTVYIVDLATLAQTSFAVVGSDGICFPPGDNGHVYVSGHADNKIRKYSTAGALITTYDPGFIGGQMQTIRCHPHSGYIFGWHTNSGDYLFCFDPGTNTLLSDSLTVALPNVFAFDSTNTVAPFFAYTQSGHEVYKVSDAGVITSAPFSPILFGYDSLAIDGERQRVYTTGQDDGSHFFKLHIETIALP